MDINNKTKLEEELLGAAVESTAEKAVHQKKMGKAEKFDELVKEAAKQIELQDAKLDKFKEMVMHQVLEMESKAQSEQDVRIMHKFKDAVVSIDGTLRPAGVKKGFKGNEGLAKSLREVDALEEQKKATKAELEYYEAQRTGWIASSKDCIKSAFVMWNEHRAAAGFFNRGHFSALASGFSSALEDKRAAREHQDAKVKDLQRVTKSLDKRKKKLDERLAKVNVLRERGQALFNDKFGNELAVLLKERENPAFIDFEGKLARLRARVIKFGKDNKYVSFVYFLDQKLEALGYNTHAIREESEHTDLYFKPKTKIETAKEKIKVAAWYREIFGEDANPNLLEGFIDKMRSKAPLRLKELNEGKLKDDLLKEHLRFLFKGEIAGNPVGGIDNLVDGRKLALDADKLVDEIIGSDKYFKKVNKDQALLRKVYLKFHNKAEYGKLDALSKVFDYILAEAKKEQNEPVVNVSAPPEKVNTDPLLPDAVNFYKFVLNGYNPRPGQAEEFLEKAKLNFEGDTQAVLENGNYRKIISYYYAARIGNKNYLYAEPRTPKGFTPDDLLVALSNAKGIYELQPNYAVIDKVFIRYFEDDAYRNAPLINLTPAIFKEIENKIKIEDKYSSKLIDAFNLSDINMAHVLVGKICSRFSNYVELFSDLNWSDPEVISKFRFFVTGKIENENMTYQFSDMALTGIDASLDNYAAIFSYGNTLSKLNLQGFIDELKEFKKDANNNGKPLKFLKYLKTKYTT